MQKRYLGTSDIYVSKIGLGTVKFGRNQGIKYPQPFELPSDTEILNLLAVAQELGINLLDTAPAYGSSEERLGKLLGTQRQQWLLATKVGEEFVNGESHYDFSPDWVRTSIERSLKRLKTDYLDILLVHSNGDDEKIIQEDIFALLETYKRAGVIRAYGMSTKTVTGGKLAVDLADVAMVTYNPVCTEERDVITHAQQRQKGIFVKKAFASGHLDKLGKDPVADAMRFIFAEPGVSSVIVGTLNPDHLRQNVEAADGM